MIDMVPSSPGQVFTMWTITTVLDSHGMFFAQSLVASADEPHSWGEVNPKHSSNVSVLCAMHDDVQTDSINDADDDNRISKKNIHTISLSKSAAWERKYKQFLSH